jgi:signal transduction histidine kinase
MRWLLYLRLITLTTGTLLPFFWMVVILGHRRQRNFERIFFFLCLALTCFCGCSLLALNAELFYGSPPRGLLRFAWIFLCLGLYFVPPLVLHLHAEFASLRGLLSVPPRKRLWLAASWLPAIALGPFLGPVLLSAGNFDFERPTHLLGIAFQVWLIAAFAVSAVWQLRFQAAAPNLEEKGFHRSLAGMLFGLAVLFAAMVFRQRVYGPGADNLLSAALMIVSLLPLGLMVSNVQRFDFLQIGRQRNLIYAVFVVFLALLYLSLVRRVGQWLGPYLPPEATAALLLFLPVVFFEPLQRMIRGLLRQTAQREVDRAQKLMGPINDVARSGDLGKLREFAERWIAEQLQLAEAHLTLDSNATRPSSAQVRRSGSEELFDIRRGGQHIGTLAVRWHGAMMSGETFAALEMVCEQLPASFDLCRLIEEKLQLERELAEQERLALVGHMAASISHNLKNPLGSMKTILQVQLESPELPESLRGETEMVLAEVNRLSSKLNQLLQFSRPGARPGGVHDRCDMSQVAENVAGVFRHDAEQRGVALELKVECQPMEVRASAEATNDILSNLLLNALEAAPSGGRVRVRISTFNGRCRTAVEDDGAGVPVGLKEKILRPFFTTKARGTGLGLAIVARRVEELGGKLELESPIRAGRGSRFVVTLPLATKEPK